MRDDLNWYIVHIKPGKEMVVKSQLSAIGVETFYPKMRVKKRGFEKIEPMFPLYMFARFSLAENFLNVNYARGVRRVVRFGRNVPCVSDDFIENLKKISGEFVYTPSDKQFKRGDRVVISEGPFRGFIGEVLRARSGEERVLILLRTAGMSPTVEVPAEILEKVS